MIDEERRKGLLQRFGPGSSGSLFRKVVRKGQLVDEPQEFSFVKSLTTTWTFATTRDNEDVYLYDGAGLFTSGAQAFIKEFIQKKCAEMNVSPTDRFVNETISAVKRSTYVDRSELNPAGFICVLNGVIDISGDEPIFLPVHPEVDPAYRFITRLPTNFDSHATCPTWKDYLGEILPDQDERDAIGEQFGYTLRPGNPFKKAFFYAGPHDTGKSTVLGVLRGLIGRENTATVSLQSLAANQFASYGLIGKLANIYTDLSPNLVKDVGLFKMLTGGSDEVPAEKKFQMPTSFVNPAKLFFSANDLPAVPWGDDAFFERWGVTEFEVEIAPERRLPYYEEVLLNEASGILNWALDGLSRLLTRGRFLDAGTPAKTRTKWRELSNSLAWFVDAMLVKDRTGEVPAVTFNSVYGDFCDEHGIVPRNPQEIGKELPTLLPGTHKTVGKPDGKHSVKIWKGFRILGTASNTTAAPADQKTLDTPASTDSTTSTGGSQITPTRGSSKMIWNPPVESVEAVETDPGDLFAGGSTRADRARALVGDGDNGDSTSPPPDPRLVEAIQVARALFESTPSVPISGDRAVEMLEARGFSETEADRAFAALAATELRRTTGDLYLLKLNGGLT